MMQQLLLPLRHVQCMWDVPHHHGRLTEPQYSYRSVSHNSQRTNAFTRRNPQCERRFSLAGALPERHNEKRTSAEASQYESASAAQAPDETAAAEQGANHDISPTAASPPLWSNSGAAHGTHSSSSSTQPEFTAVDSSGDTSPAIATASPEIIPVAESWWHSRHDGDIWGLAVPALFSILLEPMMGLVDTAIVGRLGAAQLGAVGLATIIFNFSNFLVRPFPQHCCRPESVTDSTVSCCRDLLQNLAAPSKSTIISRPALCVAEMLH